MGHRRILRLAGVATVFFIASFAKGSAQIAVKDAIGALHGFVVIRSQSGSNLGYGELSEFAEGDLVTVHLLYHFLDGSLDEETTVFSQRKTFQFVSDHHVQKGHFFPKPSDITVEANGKVTSRSTEKDGKPKVDTEQMDIPPDFSNGMVGVILLNTPADAPEFKLGMIVPTPKPRLIKLDVTPDAQQPFHIAGALRKASIFRLKTELGGIAGKVAPLVGKQPADIFVWILQGKPPMLVRIQGQLAEDTPIVSIEVAGSTFPKNSAQHK